MSRALFKIFALLLVATLSSGTRIADALCNVELAAVSQSGQKVDANAERTKLINELRQKGVPAYLKATGNGGEIPVVLLTRQTSPLIDDFLMHSFGTQSMTHERWPNDHGSLRYKNFMLDAFVPGQRPVGELNENGISWKVLNDYLDHHKEISKGVIEIAYHVTDDEMRLIDYYQRVRRASVFRVRFGLGDQSMYPKFTNLLANSTDNCFGYCKGSNIASQMTEMRSRLGQLGVPDVDKFLEEPKVLDYLRAVNHKVTTANLFDGRALNESMITQGETGQLLDKIVPPNLNPQQRQLFADWLVWLDASRGYQTVLKNLNITSDYALRDMSNPRATAVLVIDTPDKAPQLQNATYQMSGKFFHLDTTGVKPLGGK